MSIIVKKDSSSLTLWFLFSPSCLLPALHTAKPFIIRSLSMLFPFSLSHSKCCLCFFFCCMWFVFSYISRSVVVVVASHSISLLNGSVRAATSFVHYYYFLFGGFLFYILFRALNAVQINGTLLENFRLNVAFQAVICSFASVFSSFFFVNCMILSGEKRNTFCDRLTVAPFYN